MIAETEGESKSGGDLGLRTSVLKYLLNRFQPQFAEGQNRSSEGKRFSQGHQAFTKKGKLLRTGSFLVHVGTLN